jgi:eukaryotic-like serine/threonine-protein kinase
MPAKITPRALAMPLDYTQQQSSDDEQRSRQLSLKHTRPPIEVPGYKTERFLGAGAYGEVWVGLDRNTGRRVAIKFFAHRHGVDWSLLSREVEKLVFLSADRYVVQLMEVGWDSEPPYYVMEYIESGSLEDLLRDTGPLPLSDAVEMFREICVGLSHAHGKGVLHCDLKPANILLDQDHRPRLADFGQSRLSSEQTPALGTLFYMAPEQADLAAVPDVRWDVYALGAILHCMLVGDPPHRTPDVARELETATDLPDRLARYRQAIQNAPPAVAHRRVRGMDRALAEMIERCLAIDPDDRYANVQEIIGALAQRQLARQRRPVIAFGFVFPLLMLLVMGFFGWRGYQNAVTDTERLATERAVENNDFAAQLAAQQVSREIADLFEIADDEANHRPVFREKFDAVRLHELLAKLADPNAQPDQITQWRSEFFADPQREDLDNYLRRRIERLQRHPRLASIFVLDTAGTQVAAAFADGERSRSVGRNVAFRTYFHGGPVDLDQRTRIGNKVKPIMETHLSAVFQSTTTGMWKVAVSTRIIDDSKDRDELIGLFVITINLSDLEFLQLVQHDTHQRFAALVDGRPGDHMGLILQHPLFDEIRQTGQPLPDSVRSRRVPIDEQGRLQHKRYKDPLGEEEFGKAYRGLWIASTVPVYLLEKDKPTGLVVLVQEDYLEVTGPVRQLGARLLREGILAMLVVLLVTALLWYAVLRLIREPRSMPRPKPQLPDVTPFAGEPTLTAPEKVAG